MEEIFKIGDKVFYPAQGVAEIVSIEMKEIENVEEVFYVLKVIETEKKIFVPVKKAHSCGLRKLISQEEISRIYELLTSDPILIESQNWNRRYRKFLELIKTGSIFDLVSVIRDLNYLRKTKPLSFGEKKIFETAFSLIIDELSLVLRKNKELLTRELEELITDHTAPKDTDTSSAHHNSIPPQ